MSEKKNIMDSIKALESAIQKNITRKHALLRGKKVTPSVMREVDELNKVILKKKYIIAMILYLILYLKNMEKMVY